MTAVEMDAYRRVTQECPAWCGGDDHQRAVEECGGDIDREHHRIVGDHQRWSVTLLKPLEPPRRTRIELHGTDPDITVHYNAEMSTAEARSIAAWLVKAADLAETTPFI